MTLHTRKFFVLLCAIVATATQSNAQSISFGPYFGGVTDTSAQVMVRLTSAGRAIIEFSASPQFSDTVFSIDDSANASNDFVIVRDLRPLQPSREYYCRVWSGTVERSPVHHFTTFPAQGHDAPFRFTFGSCMYGPPHIGAIFPRMALDTFLFFMQDGDWKYPDIRVGVNFQSNDSLLNVAYRDKFDTTYPSHMILSEHAFDYVWDDHDCGANNNDGAAPDKWKNRAAYRNRIPHYPLANDSAGIWHTFLCGNVRFIVCDLRSQRSPNAEAFDSTGKFNPPAGHSILAAFPVIGEDQRTWLLRTLRTSTARWNVIVSSVPFMPAWKQAIALALLAHQPSAALELADKWAGFPADIDSVENTVRVNNLKNIVVISGDVHNGAMDNGTHSFFPEVVAANLDIPNSQLYQTEKSLGYDFFSQGGQTDTLNTYGRITVCTTPRQSLLLEIIDEGGKLVAQYTMEDSSHISGVEALKEGLPLTATIFPSPGHHGQRATLSGVAPGSQVCVTDILGRAVFAVDATRTDGVVRLEGTSLVPGMYIVTIAHHGEMASRVLWPVE